LAWLVHPWLAGALTQLRGGASLHGHAMGGEGGGGVGRDQDIDELGRLLADRGDQLMRAAVALMGRWEDAEDLLLQEALERVMRHRCRIQGDLEGYLRRVLYHLAAEGWRRRGAWRRKVPLLRAGSGRVRADAGDDGLAAVDARDLLVRLLRQLPPQQRAVIVLRYFEQLSEAEAAAVLGCSQGAVKSAASRGLRRLRELADSRQGAAIPPTQDGGEPPAWGGGTVSEHGSTRARGMGDKLAAEVKLAEGRS
jgi:RNA polymerase sigma factor (sigma-70 family)